MVVPGETMDDPPENVYVAAPFGLRVKLPPLQMDPLLTPITGKAKTDTVLTAGDADTQPLLSVPITE